MSTIFNELKKGVIVTFSSKLVILLIELLIAAILARLLSPVEFGVVAVVVVFTTFFNLLGDIGIGVGIVQNQKLTKKHIDGIFIFCVIIAFLSAFIFFIFKGVISNFYENEEYNRIITLLAISVFFFIANIVPQSLLRKEKKFKTIETILVFVNLVSGIFAIVFAFKGYSFYSLVFQSIIKAIGLFVANLFFSKFKPKFLFDFSGVKLIFKYSLFQFLFNIINYFSRNLDNLLIGKHLGASTLGYYDKAYQLVHFPVRGITNAIAPILHPIFAEHQNNEEVIYKYYTKILELLALLGIPLSIFLFFKADSVILLLFGDQWGASVPIFKILTLTIFMQMTLSSSGPIFQAIGKTNLLFISGLLSAFTIVTGIIFGIISKSVEVLAYGILIAFSINLVQGFVVLFRYGFRKKTFIFLNYFILGGFAGLLQVIIFSFMENFANTYFDFLIKGLISLICIVISIMVFKRNYYQQLRTLTKK